MTENTYEKDVDNAYYAALFFWGLHQDVRRRYEKGEIDRAKRDQLLKSIKQSSFANWLQVDPDIKRMSPSAKEAFYGFFDFGDVLDSVGIRVSTIGR